MNHTSKGSTLTVKPRADVTRHPQRGYQWAHKRNSCPPKLKKRCVYGTLSQHNGAVEETEIRTRYDLFTSVMASTHLVRLPLFENNV